MVCANVRIWLKLHFVGPVSISEATKWTLAIDTIDHILSHNSAKLSAQSISLTIKAPATSLSKETSRKFLFHDVGRVLLSISAQDPRPGPCLPPPPPPAYPGSPGLLFDCVCTFRIALLESLKIEILFG